MKKQLASPYYLSFLALLVWLSTAALPTRAETFDCTAITSLPYTITTQGIYCLTGNLATSMTSGYAIEIQTNNVTIDLNGYKLGGLGAGDGTQAYGIYAYQRKNITIKNGIIRGFNRGVFLNDSSPYTTSSGHVVKNILADQNTVFGIQVHGMGNTVSHNIVVDTSGSTAGTSVARGIQVAGPGAKVMNNNVSTTTTQSTTASGIYLSDSDYSLVENNTVTDTISTTGSSMAINMGSCIGVFVRNNNLANAEYGLYFAGSYGKYFNNLTYDVTYPFAGSGTPIGSNNN